VYNLLDRRTFQTGISGKDYGYKKNLKVPVSNIHWYKIVAVNYRELKYTPLKGGLLNFGTLRYIFRAVLSTFG